ncbi:MAG: deoxyribonuclease IV [Bulleidia sp.]
MIIGSHVQMKAPSYLVGAVKEALSYNANALMLYTGAPQNTKRVPVENMRCAEAGKLMDENGIDRKNLIIHAPYIINPANSVKPEVGELAVSFLSEETRRARAIGATYMVLHPGSYTTTDLETGIRTTIDHLNETQIADGIVICLETMAGKGSEIGFRFEQLAEILEGLRQPERFGVCLDTCHIHDAGYDLSDFDGVLDEFDRIIGLNRLHVIHLNDSKNQKGARKDRHANIGDGTIGRDILCAIAHNRRTAAVPKILETPYIDGKAPYGDEIALIRSNEHL